MRGASAPEPEYLRPHEAAALLGVRTADLYRSIDAHEVDAYRHGDRLVISRQSIERLKAQRST